MLLGRLSDGSGQRRWKGRKKCDKCEPTKLLYGYDIFSLEIVS